jgi:hypothetical protein
MTIIKIIVGNADNFIPAAAPTISRDRFFFSDTYNANDKNIKNVDKTSGPITFPDQKKYGDVKAKRITYFWLFSDLVNRRHNNNEAKINELKNTFDN